MQEFEESEQGVCAAAGFRAAGVAAGLKRSGGLDLMLLVSDDQASVAGTFTQHPLAAAPVRVSQARVASGTSRGVVVNSGCANAVSGRQGLLDAATMSAVAADHVGVDAAEMLVCSTGKIGSFLPMDRVSRGISAAVAALARSPEVDEQVARAILTTDSRPKRAAVRHPSGWSLGGIAKGAGMIAPNMATMLAFVTTDAVVSPQDLQAALGPVVDATFNCITVDAEPSTNDTVLAFANGRSGVTPTAAELSAALESVCRRLATAIVADGEGATKFVTVNVTGALTDEEARRGARTIADSLLVKCMLYGSDANWGRIAAALGKAGITLAIDRTQIWMGGVLVFDCGQGTGADAEIQAHAGLLAHDVEIACVLGVGQGSATILTTDLSPGYVAINADYEP